MNVNAQNNMKADFDKVEKGVNGQLSEKQRNHLRNLATKKPDVNEFKNQFDIQKKLDDIKGMTNATDVNKKLGQEGAALLQTFLKLNWSLDANGLNDIDGKAGQNTMTAVNTYNAKNKPSTTTTKETQQDNQPMGPSEVMGDLMFKGLFNEVKDYVAGKWYTITSKLTDKPKITFEKKGTITKKVHNGKGELIVSNVSVTSSASIDMNFYKTWGGMFTKKSEFDTAVKTQFDNDFNAQKSKQDAENNKQNTLALDTSKKMKEDKNKLDNQNDMLSTIGKALYSRADLGLQNAVTTTQATQHNTSARYKVNVATITNGFFSRFENKSVGFSGVKIDWNNLMLNMKETAMFNGSDLNQIKIPLSEIRDSKNKLDSDKFKQKITAKIKSIVENQINTEVNTKSAQEKTEKTNETALVATLQKWVDLNKFNFQPELNRWTKRQMTAEEIADGRTLYQATLRKYFKNDKVVLGDISVSTDWKKLTYKNPIDLKPKTMNLNKISDDKHLFKEPKFVSEFKPILQDNIHHQVDLAINKARKDAEERV